MSSPKSSNGSPSGSGGLGRRNARHHLNPSPKKSDDCEASGRAGDVEMGAIARRLPSTSGSGATMHGIPSIPYDGSNDSDSELANINGNNNRNIVARHNINRTNNNRSNNSRTNSNLLFRLCAKFALDKVLRYLMGAAVISIFVIAFYDFFTNSRIQGNVCHLIIKMFFETQKKNN